MFTAPVYEPSAYTYTNYPSNELPLLAQHYLADIAKPPSSHHTPDIIKHEREKLSSALMRSLIKNNIALVEKYHEVNEYSQASPPVSPSPTWEEEASKRDEERLFEVLNVLLPQRQRILEDFIVKFDVLVWLDVDGREDYTEQDWQTYRNALLFPILEQTRCALIETNEKKEKEIVGSMDQHAIIESQNWRASPRTPKYRSTWPDHLNSEVAEKVTQLSLGETKHLWDKFYNEAPRYGEVWHRRRKMSWRV
ncbi:hypothetical protein F5I97DRAFT_1856505 [Phlebopus sp. FC_14]|nr:hypothetical protein F5I97DRAFT_1856505 [Phlebopus sp. FC_14]